MSSPSGAADKAKPEESGAKEGEVKPTTPAAPAPPAATVSDDFDDVPDPDEDDLDDLDDMLDGFKAVRKEMIDDDTLKEGINPPDLDYENMSEEEVTNRMQAGIAGLLANLEQSPELQAEFEEMFKQMGAEMGAQFDAEEQEEVQSTSKDKAKSTPAATAIPTATPSATPTTAATTAAPAAAPTTATSSTPQPAVGEKSGAAFQDTIRRTMERMQSSGDQATAAAAAGGDDDFLTEMLKQLTAGDFAGGSEEDFSKMLMGMMEQLTNKEILYEPMKELHDKFPAWLAKNKDATSAEDLKRYAEQQTIVGEIVAKFDEPSYTDSNATDREYIVDRMQKMQAAGSPPPDLVGDMASAQEAFNATEDQCNPQ